MKNDDLVKEIGKFSKNLNDLVNFYFSVMCKEKDKESVLKSIVKEYEGFGAKLKEISSFGSDTNDNSKRKNLTQIFRR